MIDLSEFIPRKRPGLSTLHGRYIDVEPLDWDIHGFELSRHVAGSGNAKLWEFFSIGPFSDLRDLQAEISFLGNQHN